MDEVSVMYQAQAIKVIAPASPRISIAPSARLLKAIVAGMAASAFLLALVVFASSSLPALLGYKTMIVTSGSMEPAVRVGDVVVIDRAVASERSIQEGEVITFRSSEGAGMVTHRVMTIREINGRTFFQTQGDANPVPDPNLVPVDAVYGRVIVTIPKSGYLLHFASSRMGKVLMIALPVLLLLAAEVRSLVSDAKRRPGPVSLVVVPNAQLPTH